MARMRLYPPAPLSKGVLVRHSERFYSPQGGSVQDVPEKDVNELLERGWRGAVGLGYVGTTSQRPENPSAAQSIYVDLTLAKVISHDGRNWRDPLTGKLV